MVFIDGPDTMTAEGTRAFDIDFLRVVRRSPFPVYGIVDGRTVTVWVMRKIFGRRHVRFNWVTGLGFIGPVSKEDIKPLRHNRELGLWV